MRRVTLTLVAVLLAVPATAFGKSGIEFQENPSHTKPGEEMRLNVMMFSEPTDPTGGEPAPIAGVRPHVEFVNMKTDKVIVASSGKTNSRGQAEATITLPDAGPWVPHVTAHGAIIGGSEPFTLGGASETPDVPAGAERPAAAPAAADDSGFPWIPLLTGPIMLALLIVLIRRHRPSWLQLRPGGSA